MIKTKYFLYTFWSKENRYWYKTDDKYFEAEKPPLSVLTKIDNQAHMPKAEKTIDNPWQEWSQENIQKIVSLDGVCINYLATTDSNVIQRQEDFKLLEVYDDIVCHFDISQIFGFDKVKKWHEDIFKTIYPFAGELRTVEMCKGNDNEFWVWRLEFLNGITELDELIKNISKKEYKDIKSIAYDLSILLSEFLFIHPFREGNGRISRLLSDVILAKNGFPMIGLNLKKGDSYIQRVHSGYEKDYNPLAELLEQKIKEAVKNG